MISKKYNHPASTQRKSPKNTPKHSIESHHSRRKSEKVTAKKAVHHSEPQPSKSMSKRDPSGHKGKVVVNSVSKCKGYSTKYHHRKNNTEVVYPTEGQNKRKIDLNADIEPILENEEYKSGVSNLIHHKPPVFLANKTQPTTLKKIGTMKKKNNIPLLKHMPVFKQAVSPHGEDSSDLTGCEIELNEDINKKYDDKRFTVSSTEDSSRRSSEIYGDSFERERIGPQHFLAHRLLGKGSFGEVYLVEKLGTSSLYAMKVINKDKIINQNLMRYMLTERKIMSEINHPFIVKLHFAFQSPLKLFLVMDYCAGGDLAKCLQQEKRFTEERAKKYIMEVLLALQHLHKENIIFRDLKPDNVVIDEDGHALLTDFGLSKEGVYDNQSAKSFCGSLSYLAPEMIKNKGHGKSVDWYLLGVLLYEMIVGIPPYYSTDK